jgi:hypothetical protein
MSVNKFDQCARWLFAPDDEYSGGVFTCCTCENYVVTTDLIDLPAQSEACMALHVVLRRSMNRPSAGARIGPWPCR